MSLAYKLWKIGDALEEDDIRRSIIDKSNISDPNYFNIDFILENGKIVQLTTSEESVENDKFFFTKKMGGSGRAIYYLYPNLKLQKSDLSEKISLLINTTVFLFASKYSCDANKKLCSRISQYLQDFNKYIDKVKLEIGKESLKPSEKKKLEESIKDITNWDPKLINLAELLLKKEKGNYIFWFSINGETFYKRMPEVWKNWFDNPAIESNEAKEGIDFFTNEYTRVGYRPEIKVFSYDNYHESLKRRVIDNLSLSMKSARNIKFAWMYILDNLVFSYKWLEYVLIPNMMKDDRDSLIKIIKRLSQANINSKGTQVRLNALAKKEKKIQGDIDKIEKKIKKVKEEKAEAKLSDLGKQYVEVKKEMEELNVGWIRKVNNDIDEIGDLKNTITIDFLFTEINRTNLSFSIKSSIEDVIPSRVNELVKAMNHYSVDDNVKLGRQDRRKSILLQDFFNRDFLFFLTNRTAENNKNSILKEQTYLARLMLTDEKIKISDLLKRFEFNREYNYERKKRITKEGRKEWIDYSSTFVNAEEKLISFLRSINKIQE